MRINIFEAGLATLLMAGKGFLPQEDDTPKRGEDTASWNSVVLPVLPKAARKDDAH